MTDQRLECSAEWHCGCAGIELRLSHHVAELERERDAAREPITDTYACGRCGRKDGLDAVARPEVWAALSEDGRWNLLCLWCMDEIAAEKGITHRLSLHFAGRALHGTSDSDANEAHVDRLCERAERAETALRNVRGVLFAISQAEPSPDAIRVELRSVASGLVKEIDSTLDGQKEDARA